MGTIKVKTKQKETFVEEVVLRNGDLVEIQNGKTFTVVRNVSGGKMMLVSPECKAYNISDFKDTTFKVLSKSNNGPYRYTHRQETTKEVIKEKEVEVNTGAILTMIESDGIEIQRQVFGNSCKSFAVCEKGDIMLAKDAPFQFLLDYYSNNFEVTGVHK